MIPFVRLDWTDADGIVTDISPFCQSVICSKKVQMKSNRLEITLKPMGFKEKDTYILDLNTNLRIKTGQSITFYLKDEPIDTSDNDHHCMTADILGTEYEIGEKPRIKLICTDKTYLILKKIAMKVYSGKTNEVVRDMVRHWAKGITADYIANGGYIEDNKSDASSFPDIEYSCPAKPLWEALNELSQKEYTEDKRPYLFWVDKDDKFHWEYPDDTKDHDIVEGQDPIIKSKIGKSEEDEINMIIYDAGDDKNGNTVLGYELNLETESPKLKPIFKKWTIDNEIRQPGYAWDSLTWATATNDQVRDEMKSKAAGKCQAFFDGHRLMWKGNAIFRGSRSYGVGDLIEYTSNTYGIKNQLLRIKEVIQQIDKKGWTTGVKLEEDPEESAA